MKKLVMASALAAIIMPVTPASAEPHGNDRRAYASEYDRYGHYNQPRPLTQTDEVWRGPDGHYHCKRSNGTTGLVIGAVDGAVQAFVGIDEGDFVVSHGSRAGKAVQAGPVRSSA
jgi:hypothetical protein